MQNTIQNFMIGSNVGKNNEKGIVYCAFGTEYDKVAAATVSYSRKFTQLPITVLTNVPEKDRSSRWPKDVQFILSDLPTDENRNAKTNLILHTPYQETIYIDSDAVIQRPGIEKVFDYLIKADVMLHLAAVEPKIDISKFFIHHYVPVMKKYHVDPPIRIYLGGFFAFKRSKGSVEFFELWNHIWKKCGQGRDMPPLVVAAKTVQRRNTVIVETKSSHQFFDSGGLKDHGNPNAVVQHRWSKGTGFFEKFDIPPYKAHKPFDAFRNKPTKYGGKNGK